MSYVGDQVLVLLPMQYNRLKLEWAGPYKMIKRVTLVDYEVETTCKMGQKPNGANQLHFTDLCVYMLSTGT